MIPDILKLKPRLGDYVKYDETDRGFEITGIYAGNTLSGQAIIVSSSGDQIQFLPLQDLAVRCQAVFRVVGKPKNYPTGMRVTVEPPNDHSEAFPRARGGGKKGDLVKVKGKIVDFSTVALEPGEESAPVTRVTIEFASIKPWNPRAAVAEEQTLALKPKTPLDEFVDAVLKIVEHDLCTPQALAEWAKDSTRRKVKALAVHFICRR